MEWGIYLMWLYCILSYVLGAISMMTWISFGIVAKANGDENEHERISRNN